MATHPISPLPSRPRSAGFVLSEGRCSVAYIECTYTLNELEGLHVAVTLDDSYPDSVAEATSTVRRVMRGMLEDVYEVTVRVPVVDGTEP